MGCAIDVKGVGTVPKVNGIGWSESTGRKLHDFDVMIRAQLSIEKRIWSGKHWAHQEHFHVELHGGSGSSDGRYGTGVLTLLAARDLGVPVRAWFLERDQGNADELEQTIARLGFDPARTRVIRGDHTQTVGQVVAELRRLDKWFYGVIVSDPTELRLPIDVIKQLVQSSSKQNRLDVFAYMAAATHKRVRAVWGGRSAVDELKAVGMPHILLRQPDGQAQWMWAILTGYFGYPEFPAIGFHSLKTPEGKALAARLTYTKEEWRAEHQSALPFDGMGPIAPMPSIYDTPDFSLSVPSCSNGHEVAVNDADSERPAMPITFGIHSGEDSTCPRT